MFMAGTKAGRRLCPCLFNLKFHGMTRLLLGLFFCFMAVACGKPEPDGSSDTGKVNLELSCESIVVSSSAVEKTVTVTADGDWGVAAQDKSWLSVTPSGGGKGTSDILVKIAENKTGDVRENAIVFRTKNGQVSLPVKQNYEVEEVAIADAGFKAYLLEAYDVDKDGVLSTKEAAVVAEIKASGRGIKSMPELNDVFTDITYLDCSNNDLKELDITRLLSLKTMDATGNPDLKKIYVWSGFQPSAGFSKPAGAEYVEPDIPTPAGYELVWQEEFNESATGLPDTRKWWYETAEPGWVNNELQTYIAGKKGDIVTADVSDGTLKIRAIKDGNRVYSARVNTNEGWTYGYFEARLKLPKGKGTWPAFWMMPTVWSGWPQGGEIDIMEHVGCVPTEVSSSIHCQAYYHAIGTQKTAAKKIATVMDEFHVYALEWTPEYIKTYVDGVQLFHYNPDN
jgi:hypothetical protein